MKHKEKIAEILKEYVIDDKACIDCHYWNLCYISQICDNKCNSYSKFKPVKHKIKELNYLIKKIDTIYNNLSGCDS